MGRSQVKRNQAARGRGRGGRGGSGGGRGGQSRRKKGGGDLSKLGDNSFRYDRSSTANTSSGDDVYDGLLDDINLLPSAGLSEFYGDEEEDVLLPTIASLSLSSNNNKQQNVNNTVKEDWMSIDIKALDKCLKQIPLHERLKIPKHIGDYLQDKYYNDGVEHKKTVAQLREDAKCIVPEEEEIQEVEEEISKKSKVVRQQHDNEDNVSEEEDEDLESWLDDMIA